MMDIERAKIYAGNGENLWQDANQARIRGYYLAAAAFDEGAQRNFDKLRVMRGLPSFAESLRRVQSCRWN